MRILGRSCNRKSIRAEQNPYKILHDTLQWQSTYVFAKLSPNSSFSWAELALFSIPPDKPMGRPDKPMGRTDKPMGRTDKPMGRTDKLMGRTDKPMGRQTRKVIRKLRTSQKRLRQVITGQQS
jgi:hypothetical protein